MTEDRKVIRSQAVNCKLRPTGSARPRPSLASFLMTHFSPPSPKTPSLILMWRYRMKCLRNSSASVYSEGTWYQNTSLISLSHLPPETKITLCWAWLWGNFSLFYFSIAFKTYGNQKADMSLNISYTSRVLHNHFQGLWVWLQCWEWVTLYCMIDGC